MRTPSKGWLHVPSAMHLDLGGQLCEQARVLGIEVVHVGGKDVNPPSECGKILGQFVHAKNGRVGLRAKERR